MSIRSTQREGSTSENKNTKGKNKPKVHKPSKKEDGSRHPTGKLLKNPQKKKTSKEKRKIVHRWDPKSSTRKPRKTSGRKDKPSLPTEVIRECGKSTNWNF